MQLTEYLGQFVTENKKEKMKQVLSERTRRLTMVLENIYQPHNASATLRTAEILGLQDVHIIENSNKYQVNPDVVLGSAKWLDLHRYNQLENNTLSCLEALKESGYQLIAATPHKKSLGLDDLDLKKPTAILFGTELTGLSDIALQASDAFLQLPMYGFTQSYNISVTVAVIFSYLMKKLRETEENWRLNQREKDDILQRWYRSVIGKRADILVEEWRKEQN